MADRWAIDRQEDAPPTDDGLGDHAATRFRHFRHWVEKLDIDSTDEWLIGFMLSAESIRDEMRAYDQQASALLRLAQTGHYVRLLHRLHGVLDAASDECLIDESEGMKEWKVALDQERSDRVARYNALLMSLETDDSDQEDANTPLLRAIETDEQQEEAMTLLKAAIDKYGHDILTPEEVQITNKAFHIVARHANTVVISLPTWLVMPSEFSSTFGLSRWGNDLLTPEHSDKSRFIEEATTWSKLNHPHVAKFLGACHVGDRPFIVHESVRSLSEYLGEGMDRQKVWQRMYEVALALQYLHERGLVCDDLTLESVYCGLFDAKAMLLGVGLVKCDSDEQHEASSEAPVNDRCSVVASDIEALCLLSLNCLLVIAPADRSGSHGNKRNGKSAAGSRAMPAHRPSFVNEDEWKALMEMRGVEAPSSGAILAVIELLKALAGIDGRQDWFDDGGVMERELDAVNDAAGIGTIVVPAVGKPIAEILTCCTEMTGPEGPEAHIQSRLADIYSQLAATSVQGGDATTLKELIAHFCALLLRLYRLLDQKSSASTFSLALSQEAVPVSMFAFHSDIDRLLDSPILSSSNTIHTWKPKWELLSSRHQFVPLSKLIRHSSPILPVVKEESKATAFSFDQVSGKAVLALRSSRKMLLDLRNRVGDLEPWEWRRSSLPAWFLPPTEVEFKSFAEFSRGAFGSVHLGKWFNTRVVVKRVFTDMDDRATVQDQFRREADVWFKLNHINVVKMYGACHIDQPFFVCEYASGGNLDSYLEREGRDPRLVWYSLLNAALGLQYLHDNGIVHADLKADNILVGSDGVPKLTDFGLSVSSSEREDGGGGGAVGAYRWKAPETLPSKGVPGNPATFASDVYSFAMVMIEIVSGSYPWGGSMPDAAVAFHVKKGKLPPRPPGFDDPEWGLIERMCCLDPAERVTIDAVVVHLSTLVETMDMERMWSVIDTKDMLNLHQNRITSRPGVLLSLVELAKSANTEVAAYALDHIMSVSLNRSIPASEREVEALVRVLMSGNDAEKAWAATAIQNLSMPSASAHVFGRNSAMVVATGAVPVLIELARCGDTAQKDAATTALANLSIPNSEKKAIVAAGGIPVAVDLILHGNDGQKDDAGTVLWNLAFKNAPLATQIAHEGGVDALVHLLQDGNEDHRLTAAGALGFLDIDAKTKALVVEKGGVADLIGYVGDAVYSYDKEEALVALKNLCSDGGDAVRASLMAANGPAILAEVVQDGDTELAELANAILSHVASAMVDRDEA